MQLDFRTLETFFGSVVAKFEPNSAISTLLGTGATKGDGQKSVPTAREVLGLIAKSLSEKLNDAIWSGVRNASGTTPSVHCTLAHFHLKFANGFFGISSFLFSIVVFFVKIELFCYIICQFYRYSISYLAITQDLFDGFDTITKKEVTSGALAKENGNYLKLTDAITSANAVDVAKEILFSLDPRLRSQTLFMYCSQDFVDKYNEGYLLTHSGIPYNTQYNQPTVEGSNGKLIFCPLANKTDSKYIHISPKINMLYGYDQMGDVESVDVERFDAFLLSYIATMFFGVQFESIDKRRLKVVELAGL